MSGKNMNFDNKKSKKSNSYKDKYLCKIDDIDVAKTLASKKEPYGTNKSGFDNYCKIVVRDHVHVLKF